MENEQTEKEEEKICRHSSLVCLTKRDNDVMQSEKIIIEILYENHN